MHLAKPSTIPFIPPSMKKLGTLVLYEAGLALAKPSLCQPGPFLLGRLEAEGKFLLGRLLMMQWVNNIEQKQKCLGFNVWMEHGHRLEAAWIMAVYFK